MKIRFILMFFLIIILFTFSCMAYEPQLKVEPDTDLIQLILTKIEQDESILQIEIPKGYVASRYPHPERVPYLLDFFTDLYKDPLMVYPFSKILEKAVLDYFNPEYTSDDLVYQMLYYFGIDKIGAGVHRNYLHYNGIEPVELPEENTLQFALEKLYEITGAQTRYWVVGDYSLSDPSKDIDKQLLKLPKEIHKPLATYLIQLVRAYNWHTIAIRNVDNDILWRVFKIRDLGLTIPNGQRYYPEIVDLERDLDKPVFYYVSQMIAYTTMTAAQELQAVATKVTAFEPINISTPLGRLVIAGPENNQHNYSDTLLVVDLGGDDSYVGRIAANAGPDQPISICIDLSGNDHYENTTRDLSSQGSGIVGHGMLVDLAGNDTYESYNYSQGLGFFGTGILYDKDGDDKYNNVYSGQGCGYFGIGLNLDQTGNDVYYIYGLGQGFGSSGGVGALINYSGNDEYIAERYASEESLLVEYKEGRLINRNKAQGAAAGRRADISDGSAWAGGLGIIMDIEGDDIYTAGDYSLGIGYWFGTGICFDHNGNDTYNSNFNTQGCDIHFSVGALIDENGDDHHNLYDEKLHGKKGIESGGGGLGYGWDSGAGILINKLGNDVYRSQWKSFGYAEIRSQAFFIDEFGEDTYIYGQLEDGFGKANTLDLYSKLDLRTVYFYKEHCSNLGMFLDAGGEDNYHYWNFSTSFDQLEETNWLKNNAYWINPDLMEANTGKNYGIGMDVEGGTIRLFDVWGDW